MIRIFRTASCGASAGRICLYVPGLLITQCCADWTSLYYMQAQIKHSFQGLQLTHLRLIFQYSVCPADTDRYHHYVPFSEGFIEDLVHLDHEETVAGIAVTMPSLQYIHLMTCGEYRLWLPPREPGQYMVSRGCWRSTSAWRSSPLVEASPRRCLERLEEEASERIISEEDLFLSEDDRVS